MRVYFPIIFLNLFVMEIRAMALKGPALTRYDPCGLGVLYFDKTTNSEWKGTVNMESYPRLPQFNITIAFETPMSIYVHPQNGSLSKESRNYNLVIRPKAGFPRKFEFYVYKRHNNDSVPVVDEVTLNGVILCNETAKTLHTVESFNITNNQTNIYQHVCGRRSLDHTELVSVRTAAKPGDWPWHVAIFNTKIKPNETFYECGGNIVSRLAVVTAGHCVSKNGILMEADKILVVAGISNLKVQQIGKQSLKAEQLILHPSYSDPIATADLAIIRVNRFVYSEVVQPICIWGPVYDKAALYGVEALITGFGKTEDNKSSDVLRSSYILIRNDSVCIDSAPKVYGPLMNEFTICAGYGPDSGINPRNGDSGGGLVIPLTQPDHRISWFLRGIFSKCGISANKPGCDPKFYVVYTDVAPYYGWIYHHAGLEYRNNIL